MKFLLFSGLILFLKAPNHIFKLYKSPTPLLHLTPVASVVTFSPQHEWERVQSHISAEMRRGKIILWKFPLSNKWNLFPFPPCLPRRHRCSSTGANSCYSTALILPPQFGYSFWAKALASEALLWVTLAALAPFAEGNKFNAEISGSFLFFFLLPSPFPFVSFLSMSDEPVEMFCAYRFPVWLALM